ncbi:MAG: ribokinase [Lentisphaeria bacterium]
MKILNFGSLNIDYDYQVKNFVQPGETISSTKMEKFAGGKGLNQSIALARSGANIFHAGKIGRDGAFLKEILKKNNIDTKYLIEDPTTPTGHAIIQINDSGENCIILFGGANQAITQNRIDDTFKDFSDGDFLVVQNEISMMAEIIDAAFNKGMRIFLNPAPMNEKVLSYPIDKIDTLIVNETEAKTLLGGKDLSELKVQFPKQNILLTLGSQGAKYFAANSNQIYHVEAVKVKKIVDTTAAGDTFIGYFVSELSRGGSIQQALEKATQASSICIQTMGAVPSIPKISDMNNTKTQKDELL